jgi:hypothetical protein
LWPINRAREYKNNGVWWWSYSIKWVTSLLLLCRFVVFIKRQGGVQFLGTRTWADRPRNETTTTTTTLCSVREKERGLPHLPPYTAPMLSAARDLSGQFPRVGIALFLMATSDLGKTSLCRFPYGTPSSFPCLFFSFFLFSYFFNISTQKGREFELVTFTSWSVVSSRLSYPLRTPVLLGYVPKK